MYKNITRKNSSIALERDARKIIKQALTKAKNSSLKEKIEDMLTTSMDNAKSTSNLVHKKVAKYAYKKPYTSLGAFMLTGALVGFIVTKLIDRR